MIVHTWRMEISALTMFMLITSASHLRAQVDTAEAKSVAKCVSSELTWNCLERTLVAELKAGVAEAEDMHKIRYEDAGPLMGVVYLECLGKTDEKHGLKRIQWDKRKTWTIGLLKEDGKYKIVNAKESVEWRAPAGDWRVQDRLSGHIAPSSIGKVFTGKPEPR